MSSNFLLVLEPNDSLAPISRAKKGKCAKVAKRTMHKETKISTCAKNQKKPLDGNYVLYAIEDQRTTKILDIFKIEDEYCTEPTSNNCRCEMLVRDLIVFHEIKIKESEIHAVLVQTSADVNSYRKHCECLLKAAKDEQFRFVQMDQKTNPNPECVRRMNLAELTPSLICNVYVEENCGTNEVTISKV